MDYPEYIKSADELITEIEKFSGSRLHKKEDLLKLVSISLENNQMKNLSDIVFIAKYIKGLMKALQASVNVKDVPNINEIKNDLSENISKVKLQINSLLNFTGNKTKKYFELEYFRLTQDAFANFNELLSDLEWTKMYFNMRKREES